METKWIIAVCIFFSILIGPGEGNDDTISRKIRSVLHQATLMQEHLDDHLESADEHVSIEEHDEQLARRVERNLLIKADILRELRDIIQEDLRSVSPLSSPPYDTCCDITLPHYSHIQKKKVNYDKWCIDGDAVTRGDGPFHYLTTAVEDAFREKFADWKNVLKWMYYASEEGILFNIPGARHCLSYDPRLRPWYVEAVTRKPKDVVLVLDISGSMDTYYEGQTYLQLAKQAAKTVLRTLNPNDRVNVIAFNNVTKTPGDNDCYSNQLVQLTLPNKQLMEDFITGMRASGETSYKRALEVAFQMFNNTPSLDGHRDKALLMMTDGEPTDRSIQEIYDVIRAGNAAIDNSVVIFTYGLGQGGIAAEGILKNISKQDFHDPAAGEVVPGPYTPVDNPQNLRYVMATFYDKFRHIENHNDVMFLTPYLDAYGTGMQVPICVQILHEDQLTGLLCIDHALTDYFDGVSSYSPHLSSYAFVIDSELTTLIHPLLTNPTTITNDLTRVPITAFEIRLSPFTSQIINGSSGQTTISSRVVQSNGEVFWEGVRHHDEYSTYRWFPIANTGYYLVTVNPQNLENKRVTWNGPAPSFCRYHATEENANVYRFDGRIVSAESRFFFTSEAFSQYLYYRTRDDDIDRYCQVLRGVDPRNDWFKDDVIDTFASMAFLDTLMRGCDVSSGVLFYELVTVSGLHGIVPGMEVPEDYNPLLESWFDRCRSNNGDLTAGLPIENPFGLSSSGVSFCQPLYYDSADPDTDRNLYGLMNVMVRLEDAWELLTANITECSTYQCFIMNEAGLIILHGDWFSGQHADRPLFQSDKHSHVMDMEPQLANDLAAHHYAQHKECIEVDFNRDSNNGPRLHRFWRMNINNGESIDGSWYTVNSIQGTNIFLVTKTGSQDVEASCDCLPNRAIDQCRDDDQPCFCPCFVSAVNEYEFCSGRLSLTLDNTLCTPEALEYSFVELTSRERNRTVPNCRGEDTAVSAKSPRQQPDEEERNGSKGWIAGVVVSIVAVVVVVVAACVIAYKRRIKIREEDPYLDIGMIPSGDPQYTLQRSYSRSSGFSENTTTDTSYVGVRGAPIDRSQPPTSYPQLQNHIYLTTPTTGQPLACNGPMTTAGNRSDYLTSPTLTKPASDIQTSPMTPAVNSELNTTACANSSSKQAAVDGTAENVTCQGEGHTSHDSYLMISTPDKPSSVKPPSDHGCHGAAGITPQEHLDASSPSQQKVDRLVNNNVYEPDSKPDGGYFTIPTGGEGAANEIAVTACRNPDVHASEPNEPMRDAVCQNYGDHSLQTLSQSYLTVNSTNQNQEDTQNNL